MRLALDRVRCGQWGARLGAVVALLWRSATQLGMPSVLKTGRAWTGSWRLIWASLAQVGLEQLSRTYLVRSLLAGRGPASGSGSAAWGCPLRTRDTPPRVNQCGDHRVLVMRPGQLRVRL
jgi:hypothetical protein